MLKSQKRKRDQSEAISQSSPTSRQHATHDSPRSSRGHNRGRSLGSSSEQHAMQDDEEDVGSAGSQNFLNMAREFHARDKKKAAETRALRKTIAEYDKNLIVLQTKQEKARDDRNREHRVAVLTHIKAILRPAHSYGVSTQESQDAQRATNKVLAPGAYLNKVLYASRSVTKGLNDLYESSDANVFADEKDLLQQWQLDRTKVEKMLKLGRNVVGRTHPAKSDSISAKISNQANKEALQPRNTLDVDEEVATVAVFKAHRDLKGHEDFNRQLRYVERGVRMMTKALPSEQL